METNDWNDAERRVEKAQELFEQHKWQEALEELQAATDINPYNGSWFFNIGLTLDELGRLDEAVDAYTKALSINGDDIQSLLHQAIDLHHLGRFGEALAGFEKIQSLDPSFEPAYCGRILTYSDLGDHDRAEEMFYLARLYKDYCPHCYYNIGISLAARGLFDKAIYCWQRTLDSQGAHPQVHVRIAEAYWNKGELEHARQHYVTGLRQDPGNIETLLDLSDLLIEMSRLEEAGEKIRRAVELGPEDPAAHYCLGRWLSRRDKLGEAADSLRKALQIDPTFPSAHVELASVTYKQGKMTETRQHLRAEVQLRPEDPRTLMDLGNLLIDVGESKPALEVFKRLAQIQPLEATSWQNLAVAQFLRRKFKDGIASCREALRLDPNNVMATYNLGLANGQMRQYDIALRHTARGLELAPRDPALLKLEFRLRIQRLKERAQKTFRRIFGRR